MGGVYKKDGAREKIIFRPGHLWGERGWPGFFIRQIAFFSMERRGRRERRKKRAHKTDHLASDWQENTKLVIKIMFLGKVETTVRSGM